MSPHLVDLHALANELKTRHPAAASIAVALDGSNVAERSIAVASRLTLGANRPGVSAKPPLTLMHISDASKTYLPPHLTPGHLRRQAEDLAMQHHIGSVEWLCREKLEGLSTLKTLTTLAERHKIDVLVLGSYGRKGEKLEMLGTVSDGALRSSHSSICIVRSTSSKIGSACRYTFASDGSHASGIAFSVLVHFLALPNDIVNVVFVTAHDEGNEQEVAAHYASILKEANLAGSAVVKRVPASTPIHSGILDFVQEQSTDILVIGVSGYGEKKLGSVSETISREALCTTLVIKDGYQIDARHYAHAGAATLSHDMPHGRSH